MFEYEYDTAKLQLRSDKDSKTVFIPYIYLCLIFEVKNITIETTINLN